MLLAYLKTAFRQLLRHKSYTAIHLVGLALGIGCCLLALLYLRFEYGYDRHHDHAERIYRVVSERRVGEAQAAMANAPLPAGPALAEAFPEIEASVRLLRATNGAALQRAEQRFTEPLFFFADPAVFDVFTLPFVLGDPATALRAPHSVVLTERMRTKYFGAEDPLGQTIQATLLGQTGELVVTGVIADPPAQSHFDVDLLVPFASPLNGWNQGPPRWETGMLGAWTYLRLAEPSQAAPLAEKLPGFVADHVPTAAQPHLTFSLQRLTDIHLHSHRVAELGTNGRVTDLHLFGGVALLVLLLAGINFVNLSTAQALRRAKEVGIRKAFGAARRQLVGQYLGEALLVSLAAAVLGLALAVGGLPVFGAVMGKALAVVWWRDAGLLVAALGLGTGMGVLAGWYPALVLARYGPLQALRGQTEGGPRRWVSLRHGLLVGQFAAALLLLVALWTVLAQVDFLKNRALGFDEEQLVVITNRSGVPFPAFKEALQRSPHIRHVTVTARVPGGRHLARTQVTPEGRPAETKIQTSFLRVEQDFPKTLALTLRAGRDFTATDQHAVLVNEAAVQAFGWHEGALGKTVVQHDRGEARRWQVIGVVADVHFASLHTAAEPMILAGGIHHGSRILARLSPDDPAEAVAHLQRTWATFSPATPLDFYFLDTALDRQYRQEERLRALVQAGALLALFLAGIGLFGLVALSAEQRRREMGIRKVLGASLRHLLASFAGQYVAMLGAGAVLALPLAYLATERWLSAFAYRVDVGIGVYLLALLGVGVLTLSIVVGRSLSVAAAHPVETLREG